MINNIAAPGYRWLSAPVSLRWTGFARSPIGRASRRQWGMDVMAGKKFKLLGLSGSIRRESYCKAILETIREQVSPDVEVRNFDLEPIPPYNQDLDNENGWPAPVRALREAVIEADGIIAVTPEYNHGMSGILKNAVDWVSRPGYESILKGKVVLTISVSNRGGLRAQNQMHATFLSTVCRITPGREIVVIEPAKKITAGRVTDEQMLRVILRGVDTMAEEICLFQGLPKRVDAAAEARKAGPRPKGD
jgi:chromate reductase, NAD(P)H dehydrogenase (quinone)